MVSVAVNPPPPTTRGPAHYARAQHLPRRLRARVARLLPHISPRWLFRMRRKKRNKSCPWIVPEETARAYLQRRRRLCLRNSEGSGGRRPEVRTGRRHASSTTARGELREPSFLFCFSYRNAANLGQPKTIPLQQFPQNRGNVKMPLHPCSSGERNVCNRATVETGLKERSYISANVCPCSGLACAEGPDYFEAATRASVAKSRVKTTATETKKTGHQIRYPIECETFCPKTVRQEEGCT